MTKQRNEQDEEFRRRLRHGLFWSLALHALVLGGGLSLSPWQDAVGVMTKEVPLTAQLLRPALPALPSAPVERVTRPRQSPVSATTVPTVVSAVPPEPTFSAPASGGDVAVSVAPQPAAIFPATRPSPATPGEGLDANALRGYRLALAVQARRFKRYPAQAQAAGWAGTTEVRLMLAAGGRPAGVEILKGSGYDALDRAAVVMMETAVQRTPVPAVLQEQAFAITLPVVFNLDE